MNDSRPTKLSALTFAVAALGAFASSCGGSPSASPDTSSELSSCSSETRAVRYAANLSRESTSGAFTGILVKSDPGPPVKGTNTWTLKIVDANGVPQPGLTLTPVANMPDHNHPPNVVARITDKGGGVYEATPVYLFMAGYWEVSFSWVPASGAKETVMFPICIPS
jgi:YtkA-like